MLPKKMVCRYPFSRGPPQVLASRASSLTEAGEVSPVQRICAGSPEFHQKV